MKSRTAFITRRAMTLLEVLAAVVLLGIMAVTLLPLLREVAAANDAPESPTIEPLIDLADAVVEDPESFGLKDWPMEPATVSLSGHDAISSVTVRALPALSMKGGGWLVIESGKVQLIRWVAMKVEEQPAP